MPLLKLASPGSANLVTLSSETCSCGLTVKKKADVLNPFG